jgi:hypothetical protein
MTETGVQTLQLYLYDSRHKATDGKYGKVATCSNSPFLWLWILVKHGWKILSIKKTSPSVDKVNPPLHLARMMTAGLHICDFFTASSQPEARKPGKYRASLPVRFWAPSLLHDTHLNDLLALTSSSYELQPPPATLMSERKHQYWIKGQNTSTKSKVNCCILQSNKILGVKYVRLCYY